MALWVISPCAMKTKGKKPHNVDHDSNTAVSSILCPPSLRPALPTECPICPALPFPLKLWDAGMGLECDPAPPAEKLHTPVAPGGSWKPSLPALVSSQIWFVLAACWRRLPGVTDAFLWWGHLSHLEMLVEEEGSRFVHKKLVESYLGDAGLQKGTDSWSQESSNWEKTCTGSSWV